MKEENPREILGIYFRMCLEIHISFVPWRFQWPSFESHTYTFCTVCEWIDTMQENSSAKGESKDVDCCLFRHEKPHECRAPALEFSLLSQQRMQEMKSVRRKIPLNSSTARTQCDPKSSFGFHTFGYLSIVSSIQSSLSHSLRTAFCSIRWAIYARFY